MKDSDDVSRLFAMFGEKKSDSYREVYEEDQNRATFERWPIFKRIQVETGLGPDVAPSPRASRSEQSDVSSSNSVVGELRGAPRETQADSRPLESVVTPKPFTIADTPEPEAPVPPVSVQDGGNLHSLFKRLQGPGPQAVPAPAPATKPEQPAGSIRSLFNRLSRP